MLKYFVNILLVIYILTLSACNSSSGSASNTESADSRDFSNLTLNGIVVDGYISGATVCIDFNNNSVCDTDEPVTTTNRDGKFNFNALNLDEYPFVKILAFGGIDMSTEMSFHGHINRVVDSSILNSSSEIIVSPLTDMVANRFLNSESKDTLALADAKSIVSDALNIEQSLLYNNPMENIALFIKSQELQQIKFLLETVANKSMNSSLKLSEILLLEEQIKKELIHHSLNIERILIAMEINLNSTIADNEKTFVVEQFKELEESLESLSKDTSLDVNNLNRLQKLIANKILEATSKLNSAVDGNSIDIVNMDMSAEITASVFDRTDAIEDIQACQNSNGYNVIANNALMPERTEDTNNLISIKSEYTLGDSSEASEVKLYYPTITQTQKDDRVIVFQEGYYFAFDKAWIDNIKKSIYIMTPKEANGSFSCYRYELNFLVEESVKGTKVFRYTDI